MGPSHEKRCTLLQHNKSPSAETHPATAVGQSGSEELSDNPVFVPTAPADFDNDQPRWGDSYTPPLYRKVAQNITHHLLQDEIPSAFAAAHWAGRRTRPGSGKEALPLKFVKIDTDSIDGDLLRGFLRFQDLGLWTIENFVFEASDIGAADLEVGSAGFKRKATAVLVSTQKQTPRPANFVFECSSRSRSLR